MDDIVCRNTESDAAEVPSAIAMKANIFLEYESPEEGVLHGIDVPSEQRAVTLGDGSLRLLDTGTHSLLAKELIADQVQDFINVSAYEVAEVVVSTSPELDASPLASLVMKSAEPIDLYSRMVNKNGKALAGKVSYLWEAEDKAVLNADYATMDTRAHIIATPLQNGSTKLAVGVSFDDMGDNFIVTLNVTIEGLP